MFMDRNLECYGDVSLSWKEGYDSNENFNWAFHEIDKLMLKHLWKSKESRLDKAPSS